MHEDALAALLPVANALRDLRVEFYIGGSLASSAFGLARSTLDADVVAALRLRHVRPLAQRLSGAYYADEHAIARAVREPGCFNLIHLQRMYKVDVFVAKKEQFDQQMMSRVRLARLLADDPATELPFASPEDVILHKLLWYRQGGEVSERQWNDALNVLRVQADRLDFDYLARWASSIGIPDLLDRSIRQAKP